MQSIIEKLQKIEKDKGFFNMTNETLVHEYSKIAIQLLTEIENLSSQNYCKVLVRGTVYQVSKENYEIARDQYKDDREKLKNCIAFEIGVPVSTIHLE